ncbi:MAG: hypothetical protein M1830_000601 [Pleopsidium flavum]|nr:MAG: hypothetical protein M1830_000601 [Pleopsidium flavum]
MEVLHSSPSVDSFTSLSTHQSQTPDSFYSGPPVLHHHTSGAKLIIPPHDLNSTPALAGLRNTPQGTSHDAPAINGDADEQEPDVVVEDIDVWVTSENFILFSPSKSTGLSIPYPNITLHAIQRLHLPDSVPETQGLFLQISTSDGFDDHDTESTISLTIIPSSPPPLSPSSTHAPQPTDPTTTTIPPPTQPATQTPTTQLFTALTTCSNLHPDPIDQSSQNNDDDQQQQQQPVMFENGVVDGHGRSLPPPVPGSGGWITAENVGEFFDEDGEWRGGGLGPGAGVVRGREEDEVEVMGEEEGDGDDGVEGPEERKWRRTG